MPKLGQRVCDICRKYFDKSELIANARGQFCRACWEKGYKCVDKWSRLYV